MDHDFFRGVALGIEKHFLPAQSFSVYFYTVISRSATIYYYLPQLKSSCCYGSHGGTLSHTHL